MPILVKTITGKKCRLVALTVDRNAGTITEASKKNWQLSAMAIKQVHIIEFYWCRYAPKTMEDIFTQENLSSSDGEEPVDGPFAQYYDVEMDLNQPQPTGNNLDGHGIPLFVPDRNSPLHPQHTTDAPTDCYASDTHESHHSPNKRCSDDGMKAGSSTPTKRMRTTASLTVRKANRQLVDISTRQREVLQDQEERLQAALRQQNEVLQTFRTVQRNIAQERQQFEERLAQAERQKASRENELINEIKTIKVGH